MSDDEDHWIFRHFGAKPRGLSAAPGSLMPLDWTQLSYRSPYVSSNRMGLTREQEAQRRRAHAASARNAPYLAIPPLAGAAVGGLFTGGPVVVGAVARGAAAGARAIGSAVGRAEDAYTYGRRLKETRQVFDGWTETPVAKGTGMKFTPRKQSGDEVRIMRRDRASEHELAQREHYAKQNVRGNVVDKNGEPIPETEAHPKPKKNPKAHFPAKEWLRRLRGKS